MAKILITDDAFFMRSLLKGIMEKLGHTCFEAVNGSDMLEKYAVIQPDLVFLDITMPVMDGLEAIRILTSRYPDARVVMCSAMGQQAMVIEAVQCGAKDFIVKPFERSRVSECVNNILNLH